MKELGGHEVVMYGVCWFGDHPEDDPSAEWAALRCRVENGNVVPSTPECAARITDDMKDALRAMDWDFQ